MNLIGKKHNIKKQMNSDLKETFIKLNNKFLMNELPGVVIEKVEEKTKTPEVENKPTLEEQLNEKIEKRN